MALISCDGWDHYVMQDILKKWSNWHRNENLSAVILKAYARGVVCEHPTRTCPNEQFR